MATPRELFRLRSFVRRDGRLTQGQERAQLELWPQFGLQVEDGLVDYKKIMGREAPCFLEIGFGTGQSLLAAAEANPDKDFIGVETHKPGIGALFLGIKLRGLTNLRVFSQDVIDVLAKAIPAESLAGVQIFFPDPWPKRRHHPRRLIQPAFLKTLLTKIRLQGSLHLATDWDDYAKHMLSVVSQESQLKNLAGPNQFGTRSMFRPIQSKFEQRAIRLGHTISELQLEKL